MSLIPFEDIFYPERRHYSLVPAGHHWASPLGGGLVSSILNDGFRNLQALERELGEFGVDGTDNGKRLNFRCNVAGYRPDELKVDLEGNELVISGEHKDDSEGQSIHRTFVRRITVPEHIVKETIKCDLDEKGRLTVLGQSKDVPASQKQSIPIGFKQSAKGQNAVEGSAQNEKTTCKK